MIKRHVLNKLLLLRLIQLAGHISGATRLQKLIFKAESIGRDDKKSPTFNYRFIRWHYGPYSEELKEDLSLLIKHKFVDDHNNEFTLTPLGEENIRKAIDIFEQLESDTLLHEVIDTYANMNLNKLLRNIYEDHSIEDDYEKGETIIPVIDEESGELTHV